MTDAKYIPLRTCVVCRNKVPKSSLIRIAKNADGNVVCDVVGKKQGRGCYVCNNDSCKKEFIKKHSANKAFKMQIDNKLYEDFGKLL